MNDLSATITAQSKRDAATPEPANPHAQDAALARGTVWFFVAIAVIAVGWAASVALFGLIGLIMPALAAVPVVFLLLLALSWG
jgi:hypothetical protein